MKHYIIHIFGKVQGVFFRAETQEQAQKLNLVGSVKNESDGSVRIEVQGELAELEPFIAWCKRGPPLSQVEHIEITDVTNTKKFQNFSII